MVDVGKREDRLLDHIGFYQRKIAKVDKELVGLMAANPGMTTAITALRNELRREKVKD